ncbi:MAG: hypothetical protein GEU90_16265 [Gemmatimonas sp.]|nr:hypothetical protein [Gemmatimonas sp.]
MTYADHDILPLSAEWDGASWKAMLSPILSRRLQIAAVFSLLILPATLQAQQRPGGSMGAMRTNPVARLLEQRDSLTLSEDQVEGLETIRARLDEQNEPLLAQLPDGPPSGGDRRAAMQQIRPVIEELMTNNRAAIDEAMALLTEDQQGQAREMLPRPRRPGGPGGAPGGRRPPQ